MHLLVPKVYLAVLVTLLGARELCHHPESQPSLTT
jgi:hypothetical protein